MPWNSSVDTKWGFCEFGYPMTLQNFNKSPKLESCDSFTVPYQHKARLTGPCPATRASPEVQHHCTPWSVLGWDTAQGRNMHGTRVYCMPWARTKGHTKLGLSLLWMCFPEYTKQLAGHRTGRCGDVLAGLNVCSVRADAIHLGWASADCKTKLDEKGP